MNLKIGKMSLEQRVLNLCSPGKILRTKEHLRFFMGARAQGRDRGIYIIKSSEIHSDINRIFVTLNDDWVLKFNIADFDSKWGEKPEINKWIEVLGN